MKFVVFNRNLNLICSNSRFIGYAHVLSEIVFFGDIYVKGPVSIISILKMTFSVKFYFLWQIPFFNGDSAFTVVYTKNYIDCGKFCTQYSKPYDEPTRYYCTYNTCL